MPSSQLPDRPNVDHLKHEAKALHRAYLRGDAEAHARVRAAFGDRPELKLLDAQRVIAREYGFAKWSELRDAVERRLAMADTSETAPHTRPVTSRTRIAIAIARGIAAAYGHGEAGECHFALGVLREGENPAVGALHRAGVPLRELRQTLERALPAAGPSHNIGTPLEASPSELALIERARQEAIERGDAFIANQHLFLALLRDQRSAIREIFAGYGISYDRFSQHLDVVLSGV